MLCGGFTLMLARKRAHDLVALFILLLIQVLHDTIIWTPQHKT